LMGVPDDARRADREPPRPADPGLFRLIYTDYRRFRVTGGGRLETIFLTQGFWACFAYRLTRWVMLKVRFAVVRKPLTMLLTLLNKLVEITTGIYIPARCQIGEGLYIGHFGTIVLPSHGSIGDNCNISEGVVIGLAGRGDKRGAPVIGNRVFFGSHAIVIGKITVGDDAVICAGAMVTRSVPPRGVALGNPARVISYEGSFDQVRYDGMETDPARVAALAAAGETPQAVSEAH
jgi:serine O-acetyltransferase